MKYSHSSRHRKNCPHDPEHRAQLGLRLRHTRLRLGWSIPQAAKYFQVTERTWHNWENGSHRIPFAVYKLARLLSGMELPSPGWDGWRFEAGMLITPEGRQISPKDGAWWSLLVRQAASFRTTYHEVNRLRTLLDGNTVQRPGLGGAATLLGCAAVGLVPSKTSPNLDVTYQPKRHQSDTIQTPCKPPLDYLTPSSQPPAPAPTTLESALTPSFALPWTPICGVRLSSYRLQPGSHLVAQQGASKAHLKQLNPTSQPPSLPSSPGPKSRLSTSATKLPGVHCPTPDTTPSAMPAAAKAAKLASALGGAQ